MQPGNEPDFVLDAAVFLRTQRSLPHREIGLLVEALKEQVERIADTSIRANKVLEIEEISLEVETLIANSCCCILIKGLHLSKPLLS